MSRGPTLRVVASCLGCESLDVNEGLVCLAADGRRLEWRTPEWCPVLVAAERERLALRAADRKIRGAVEECLALASAVSRLAYALGRGEPLEETLARVAAVEQVPGDLFGLSRADLLALGVERVEALRVDLDLEHAALARELASRGRPDLDEETIAAAASAELHQREHEAHVSEVLRRRCRSCGAPCGAPCDFGPEDRPPHRPDVVEAHMWRFWEVERSLLDPRATERFMRAQARYAELLGSITIRE